MPNKKHQAFQADAANIGGAHLILSDYVSYHRRVDATGPTREVLQTKRPEPTLQSQRLSRNRAARRAAVDSTPRQHMSHVHHLARRIEDMYSTVERRKNVLDATVYPVLQSRPAQHSPSLLQQLREPWEQGYGYSTLSMSPRPGSAPAGWTSRRRHSGDHYQGWSVTNSLRDTFPCDDFPVTRYLKTPVSRMAMQHTIYKQAILAEVVASRMYKHGELRQLFKTYLKLAPLHDKQVVEHVVAELKAELLVD